MAGLSEQLNYHINSAPFIGLRKYFSHLNAEVEYTDESSITLHLGYTWDDMSYFGASVLMSLEVDTEEGGMGVVLGEMTIDEQADRYTDDFETFISPLLLSLLEALSPAKVLKSDNPNAGN